MAAGATYTPIATTTLGSSATCTFSSIPSTYTDLCLVVNGGITNDAWDMRFRFNNDSSAIYSQTALVGDGTVISSTRTTGATKITTAMAVSANNLYAVMTANIMNYANTSTYKTAIVRYGAGSGVYAGSSEVIGLWRSTAAINRIDVFVGASNDGIANLYAGTTLTLYGITAA